MRTDVRETVAHAIEQLDKGALRVAEIDGNWTVHQWLKKAVLLSFRLEDNAPMPAGGYSQFYDKVPSKFANYTAEDFAAGGFRVVPPAIARRGSFIAKNVVLMPSYTNIGAYVDEGRWSTRGPRSVRARRSAERAPVGRRRHRWRARAAAGEPGHHRRQLLHRRALGSRRRRDRRGKLGDLDGRVPRQSTKIYDRETGEVSYGRIPAGSVVVAGNLPSKDGSLPVLRSDRQEGRREDPREGRPERAAARRLMAKPHTVVVYGIPNCDTVKKARVWLDDHGVEFEFHDFRSSVSAHRSSRTG